MGHAAPRPPPLPGAASGCVAARKPPTGPVSPSRARSCPLVPSPLQEEYLSEEEFEVVFGMDKEDFRAMPPWKRINAKKAKGLF
jgi:hypothetical protein